jgi:hypothetical protein
VKDKDEKVKKEEDDDYYAGCYWGRNSYDSEYLSTEKTDDKLKKKALENLQRVGVHSDAIKISVRDGLILLEGEIETYDEKTYRKHSLEKRRCSKGFESINCI